MADALTESTTPASHAAARPEPPARTHRSYRIHFALATILLAAIVGAAVGSFIVFVGRPSHAEKQWSAWEPHGSATDRADQIVNRIGSAYRLPNGQPLVGIKYGPPFVQVGNNTQSVVGFDVAQRSKTRYVPDEAVYDASGTIEFVLCGLSDDHKCAIPGEPSAQRGRVLGREALELALYSFRYIPGTQAVFMLMPPNGKADNVALFLKKSELKDELSHPLRRTLPATRAPSVAEGLSPEEDRVVERLVEPHLYRVASYQQASNRAVIAVLTP